MLFRVGLFLSLFLSFVKTQSADRGTGHVCRRSNVIKQHFKRREINIMVIGAWGILAALLTFAPPLRGEKGVQEFFISAKNGDDSHPGSRDMPFLSISRCVEEGKTEAPIICTICEGIYRETVSIKQPQAQNILIRSDTQAKSAVELSGLRVLDVNWQQLEDSRLTDGHCVFSGEVPSEGYPDNFQQIFFNGSMMVEARWPNLDVEHVAQSALSRDTWAPTEMGSIYGTIKNADLRQHPFSWNGALATLQVAHQFYTWTRPVANHTKGSDSFEYTRDLPGLAGWDANPKKEKSKGWEHNQFFLSGKLEALDAPGEWYLETTPSNTKILHFWSPTCAKPPQGSVEVKVRDYVLDVGADSSGIDIRGPLTIRGGSVRMAGCDSCAVSNIDILYPTYNREIPEMFSQNRGGKPQFVNKTGLIGTHLRVSNVTFSYSNNNGIELVGDHNIIENCLVRYTDWLGTLTYVPLSVKGNNVTLTRCTVHDFGNAGITAQIPNTPPSAPGEPDPVPKPMNGRRLEVSYTHIYRGGLVGKDTAALYTGGWKSAGLHWHHNWVHDATEKCVRADDQSRNMTVHHNVIYNCGVSPLDDSQSNIAGFGLLLKGNGHYIFANTIMNANYSEICLPSCIEPYKPWAKQYPLRIQNTKQGTQVFNTVARFDLGFPCSCHNSSFLHLPGGNQTAIFNGTNLKLQDPTHMDFRPAQDSPLVDAGIEVPPYTNGFVGKAPDIGAYEYGGDRWIAGCSLHGC